MDFVFVVVGAEGGDWVSECWGCDVSEGCVNWGLRGGCNDDGFDFYACWCWEDAGWLGLLVWV